VKGVRTDLQAACPSTPSILPRIPAAIKEPKALEIKFYIHVTRSALFVANKDQKTHTAEQDRIPQSDLLLRIPFGQQEQRSGQEDSFHESEEESSDEDFFETVGDTGHGRLGR
jgi:hypothetical protein